MRRPGSLLPLALVLAALPLAAQTAPAPSAADLLEEITSTEQLQAAGKAVQDVTSAAADVVVLTSRDLKALGYRTLGDALAGVQGFRLNEDRAYQDVGIRGLYILDDQNTRILIMLDGHVLNSPGDVGSSKVGEDFGLPLELVDHIEIVRGPASSLYGNNAFMALVNVVSKASAQTQRDTFEAAASAGTGGVLDSWASLRGKVGATLVNFNVGGFQRQGTALTQPELQAAPIPAAADREDRKNLNLRVQNGDLSLAGFFLDRTQRLALAPYQGLVGDNGNWYQNRRLGGELRWEPHQDRVDWTVRLYGDRAEFNGDYNQDPARGGGGLSTDRDPTRSLGAEVQARIFLSSKVTLTLGTEQQQHRFNGVSTSDNLQDVVMTDAVFRIGNTYAEAEWRPGPAWTFVAGLQDASWTPSTLRNTAGGAATDLAQDSMHRDTPRLSAIWKPNALDVVKVLYGQGFRFPTVYERYYNDGQSQEANPGLAPEVITSTQVIWSHKWTPRLRTQVSATDLRWDKLIVSGTDEAMAEFQNAPDRIRGRAYEAEATWRLRGFELYGGWGWYSWVQTGQPMPDVASQTAVLRAIQRSGDFSLALEGHYVSARENAATQARVPGNVQVRASARMDWPHAWGQLSVEDLADTRRQDLVGPEYAPVNSTTTDGRRFLATVGMRF